MGRPWDNGRAKRWWALGRQVRQKEPAPSAEVRRATQQAVHAPPTRLRAPATSESEGLRAYAELQRKHRAAYGDNVNEEAREAAGKAALAALGQGVALTRLGGTSPLRGARAPRVRVGAEAPWRAPASSQSASAREPWAMERKREREVKVAECECELVFARCPKGPAHG